MYTFRTISTLYIVLFSIAFSSCTEEKIIETQNGSVMGFINLLDETGIEVRDKSNIKVTLDAEHNALTNSTGRFNFENIKPGTYRIIIEKEGYGTVKQFNYLFAGGKTPGVLTNITLVELSKINITNKVIEPTSTSIRVKGTMDAVESYFFYYYYVDKPDADITDNVAVQGYSSCCGSITSFEHYLSLPANLPSPCYLIAGAVSTGNQNGTYNYYDYEKAKSINPAVKKLFDAVKVK